MIEATSYRQKHHIDVDIVQTWIATRDTYTHYVE